MPKPNYQHARRQKEMARKARQQDKQKGRVRDNPAPDNAPSPNAGEPPPAAPAPGTRSALTGSLPLQR